MLDRASSTVPASPTTRISSSASSISLRLRRTKAWSSRTNTRVTCPPALWGQRCAQFASNRSCRQGLNQLVRDDGTGSVIQLQEERAERNRSSFCCPRPLLKSGLPETAGRTPPRSAVRCSGPLLLGALRLFVLFAILGHFPERVGATRCGCAPDCWCKRPGVAFFRWVIPWGHRFPRRAGPPQSRRLRSRSRTRRRRSDERRSASVRGACRGGFDGVRPVWSTRER